MGRGAELAELRGIVAENRLVTLTGAGGVGKTRLAVQLAAELAGGFGDGVWYVELAPITEAELVLIAAARARSRSRGPIRAAARGSRPTSRRSPRSGCTGRARSRRSPRRIPCGVFAGWRYPPELVVAQIDAVVDDIGVDAPKTGMLSSASIVEAVANRLALTTDQSRRRFGHGRQER